MASELNATSIRAVSWSPCLKFLKGFINDTYLFVGTTTCPLSFDKVYESININKMFLTRNMNLIKFMLISSISFLIHSSFCSFRRYARVVSQSLRSHILYLYTTGSHCLKSCTELLDHIFVAFRHFLCIDRCQVLDVSKVPQLESPVSLKTVGIIPRFVMLPLGLLGNGTDLQK